MVTKHKRNSEFQLKYNFYKTCVELCVTWRYGWFTRFYMTCMQLLTINMFFCSNVTYQGNTANSW